MLMLDEVDKLGRDYRGDPAAARIHSERLHMAIYEMADMPMLLRMVEGLWLRCGPLMNALETHAIDAEDVYGKGSST